MTDTWGDDDTLDRALLRLVQGRYPGRKITIEREPDA